MPNPAVGAKASGYGCLIFFWLFWTTIVGIPDVMLVIGAIQQLRTYSFVPTEATLLESRVECESDSEGTSYKPVVRYEYEWGGKKFISKRLRYMDVSFGEGNAQAVLPKAPIGGKITAYYNPRNPESAVLQTGFVLTDLVVPIFLLPFNAISVIGLLIFVDGIRSRVLGHHSLGFQKREFGGETQLKFYNISPLLTAVIALGAGGFATIFPLVIVPNSWIPANARVLWALLAIGVTTILAVRWAYRNYAELTFNDIRQELFYAPADKKFLPQTLALNKTIDVRINEVTTTDSDGDNTTKYNLTLHAPGHGNLFIQEFMDYQSAERMAKFLQERGLNYSAVAAGVAESAKFADGE